jgi:hypothetical protein
MKRDAQADRKARREAARAAMLQALQTHNATMEKM